MSSKSIFNVLLWAFLGVAYVETLMCERSCPHRNRLLKQAVSAALCERHVVSSELLSVVDWLKVGAIVIFPVDVEWHLRQERSAWEEVGAARKLTNCLQNQRAAVLPQ